MAFFPIMLDLDRVPILVVGKGRQVLNRLRQLGDGSRSLKVYSDAPSAELRDYCGNSLIPHLPVAADLVAGGVIFIGDYPPEQAHAIANPARAAGMLTNIEDVTAGCDFHTPSLVRRGDLLLTVSTGGHSPALAVRIKQFLAEKFSEDWGENLREIAAERQKWRAMNLPYPEIKQKSDEFISTKGWFEKLG
ncbi:MAG: siroheme synthase [Alphaproteobacteria bacterium]|nr:siroheme synthase [Alphaproteobacteria bacterium]